MKRLFIFIAAIFAAATVFGQNPLPNDPAVRTGKDVKILFSEDGDMGLYGASAL